MELLTAVILLHVLGALQVTSKSVHWNSTETQSPLGNHSNLGQFSLSDICVGVLRTHTHIHGWVSADLSLTNRSAVAGHICSHLGCGEVYNVRQNATTAAFNHTCVMNCVYGKPGHLNCSEATNGTCLNVTEIQCTNKTIRLVNGTKPCQGRVEVFRGGKWGTVCDDGWNLAAGQVVCSQLGCGKAYRITGEQGPFSPGSGDILLDELNCTGTETNLWQCGKWSTNYTHDCGHKEDAGVVCTGDTEFTTTLPVTTTQPQPNWTTDAATLVSMEATAPGLQAAVAGCIVLSVALILVLASNVILCGRQKRIAARVIHQTYDGSTSAIIRERSEQEDSGVNLLRVTTEDVPREAPKHQFRHRPPSLDDSSTSSCNSEEMNYYTRPIAAMPDSQGPEDLHSLGPESEGPVNGNNRPGGDSGSESEDDYENTGTEVQNLLKSESLWKASDSQNHQFVHNPDNVQRAASNGSVESSSTSSGGDYQNVAFNTETLPYPDEACHPNLEQFMLTPLSTKENSCGLNHYQGHLPESDCDRDDSSSTSSTVSYENVPRIHKADCSPSTQEDPSDQSSSDSDYDEVAI